MSDFPQSTYAPLPTVAPPPQILEGVKVGLSVLISKLGGGSGKAPDPDPDNNKSWIILLIIIIWALALMVAGVVTSRFTVTMSVLALMVFLCAVPIITVKLISRKRVVRVIAETLLAMIGIIIFVWTRFGSQSLGRWMLFVGGVLLILEIGGHLVEWNKDDSFGELAQWPDICNQVQGNQAAIEKLFRRQQIVYLSVPFGFLAGLQTGLVSGYPDTRMVLACVVAIAILASLLLTYFVIISFVRMVHPILTPEVTVQPNSGAVVPTGKAEIEIDGTKYKVNLAASNDHKKVLDLSSAATSLRKVHLFDSIHSVLLVVAFVLISLNLMGVRITLTEVILSLALSTFVFSQLPFGIGQKRLHRRVLRPVQPAERGELSKGLGEVAPMFPAFQLLNSLATTLGGSLLFYLIDETIKDRLKKLVT